MAFMSPDMNLKIIQIAEVQPTTQKMADNTPSDFCQVFTTSSYNPNFCAIYEIHIHNLAPNLVPRVVS